MRTVHAGATALIIVLGLSLLAGCTSLRNAGSPAADVSESPETERESSDADEADSSNEIAAVPFPAEEVPDVPDEPSPREALLEAVQNAVNDGNFSLALEIIEEAEVRWAERRAEADGSEAVESREAMESREVAGAQPFTDDIQLLRVRLLFAMGRFSEAMEVLDTLGEESVEARIMRAQVAPDVQAQAEAWRHALALEPNNPVALAGLGRSLLEGGDVEAADREFSAALSGDPGNVAALVGKSEIAYRRDNPEARVEWLERALGEDPDAGYLHAELGRALAENDDRSGAIEELSRAIELDPETAWHYADRGRIYQRQNRQSEALADFNSAISRESSVFLFYFYRANTLFQLGEYSRALEDYETVVDFRADYSDAWPALGSLLFRYEGYDRAAEYFARSYGSVSYDPSFIMLAALSYREDGQQQRAGSLFAEVERTSSRDSLYYDMAREFQNPRNDRRMEELVRRESNRNMQTRMRFYLGALYYSQGRERAAEYLFLQVRDAGVTGFVESELAEVYLERIEAQRSVE